MTDPADLVAARAVYDATAEMYSRLVGTEVDATVETSADLDLLEAFVESLEDGPRGPVADVGCGPGRIARFLGERGIDVFGVDLSHEMLTVARGAHPAIPFVQGQLGDLPIRTGSSSAVVSWYSIIHTPPERLGAVCLELARVVAPAGRALLAFQSGVGQAHHRADAHDTGIALTSYRHAPAVVIDHLRMAGFHQVTSSTRAPALAHETTPQTFISARFR